jgi:hypothetical protein
VCPSYHLVDGFWLDLLGVFMLHFLFFFLSQDHARIDGSQLTFLWSCCYGDHLK